MSLRGGGAGDVCCGVYVPLYTPLYARSVLPHTNILIAAPASSASSAAKTAAKHLT